MHNVPVDFFLTEGPLAPADASVAIMVTDESQYVMQLRDQRPGIFYPGHWGLFGGAIDPGETPESALRRELFEEIGYKPDVVAYFTGFSFGFESCGFGPVWRHYFEVKIPMSDVETLTLMEGSALKAFGGNELLLKNRVTPYDAFAIWMHMTQATHLRYARHERSR